MVKMNSSISKKFFFTLFFIFIFLSVQGQSKSEFWQNVRFGGSIGLGFGNDSFNAAISPSAIYEFNEHFALGTALNYNYYKFQDFKLSAYGGSILSFVNPLDFLQLSAEFEQLRINRSFSDINGTLKDNYWNPSLFLGIGYRQRNVTFGVRYNVLHDENKSIYSDALMPFIRVYF